MGTRVDAAIAAVDRWIAMDVLTGGLRVRARARLIVAFSLFFAVVGAVSIPLHQALRMPRSARVLAVATVLVALAPLVLRWTRSAAAAAHWLLAVLAGSLWVLAAVTGGLGSGTLALGAVVPVLAILLAGRRAGLAWAAVILVGIGVHGAPSLRGVSLPVEGTPIYHGLTVATLTVAVLALAWIFTAVERHLRDGLEQSWEETDSAACTAALALEHVDEGLVVARGDGTLTELRSGAVERWFGPIAEGTRVWQLIGHLDPTVGEWIRLGWEVLAEDVLPAATCLEQLPRGFEVDGDHFALQYRVLGGARVLVKIADVTQQVHAHRADEEERELVNLVGQIIEDRVGFLAFFRHAARDVAALAVPGTVLVEEIRVLCGLKNGCGQHGLIRVARLCHELESRLVQERTPLTPRERAALNGAWNQLSGRVQEL